MNKRSIFIAATGQNVGKTTLCLGLIAGLQRRYSKVGFIKPVGQEHVQVGDNTRVDKDAVLFRNTFDLNAKWIDGKINEAKLMESISQSFQTIASQNDYTVVEGTGHVGVGSILNLNNARVAAELGLDMVIIASGGLGSAYDELALNYSMCQRYGVNLRGVILNRVLENKKEMITDYFSRILRNWNVPLIGCVPFNEFLSSPTIRDFEALFKTNLISGEKHHYRHFKHFRLVAGSLEAYKEDMVSDDLLITPASREDIIDATIDYHHKLMKEEGIPFMGGMILTSRHPPEPHVIEKIRKVDIPTLYAPLCSYDAMVKITSYVAKIRVKDSSKIVKAINLVERNIDFDRLCDAT